MITWNKPLSQSDKITILFLSWRDIKAPKKGGAEVYTHEMLKRIDFNQFRIIHLSPMFQGGVEQETIDGITYLRKGNILSVIRFAKHYYKRNRERIDYVVDQCNTHRFFTKFWVEGQKRVFFIHQLTREIWKINSTFPVSFVGYHTEIPFLKLSKNDPTMTVSKSTKNDLIDLGFDANNVKILPEGIEFDHWKREDFLPKELEPTFIYVGRFVKYKGIDATIEAFAKLKEKHPKAKLWVVGKKNDNYITSSLKPIMDQYQITYGNEAEKKDITFFGFVSDEKKLELMSRAHALIFPSQREGWGLIVTEAAAVGTPSIVYHSKGIVDAVDDGDAGYLCKKNAPENLTELMHQVLTNKKNYEHVREQAYQYSLNFHWQNTANHFEKFFDELQTREKLK